MNTAQTIMNSPAVSAGFEMGDLDSSELNSVTFDVAVREDADGEPLSGFIVVGKNSVEYQTASNAVRIDNIKRSSKRSKQVDTSTDEGAGVISRTVAANDKTIALAVVVGWFGFNLEGSPMAFDKTKVEQLFTKFPQWQAKVSAALEIDANFMKV